MLGELVSPLGHEDMSKFADPLDHPPALSPEPEDDMEEDELEESVTAGRTSVAGEEGREMTPDGEDVGRLDVDTGFRNPLPQSVCA
jgi:hypothetical protein